MVVRALIILFSLLSVTAARLHAQYASDWIKPGLSYVKVKTAADGIYRLTYANLKTASFPVDGTNPANYHLLHRGLEQSIYIKGSADATFNAWDYIEFAGTRNDGTLDSLLYRPSSVQPHKYFNLFSDTTAYFLVYDPSSVGTRIDTLQLANTSSLSAESYWYAEKIKIRNDDYSAGYTLDDITQSTYFDLGEGWTSLPIQPGQTITDTLKQITNTVPSGGLPQLDLMLVGRDYVTHDFTVWVGPNTSSMRQIASPSFSGFPTYRIQQILNWSDISASGELYVQIVAAASTNSRYQVSLSYARLTFPQAIDWSGLHTKKFNLAINTGNQSYVSVLNPSNTLQAWDITDPLHARSIRPASPAAGTFNIVVPGTSVQRTFLMSDQVLFPVVTPVTFQSIDNTADYIIITNQQLRSAAGAYADPVKAFADYRASATGGNHKTLVVNIDQLYDQFNYGETSPLAIYSFMKYMVGKGSPKYLFLIGKGRDVTYSAYARLPVPPTEMPDLVPSAGYPGGDGAFTAHLGGGGDEPFVPTGRLAATTPAQVAGYLDKIKEHEQLAPQAWMKEVLHLSGGGFDGGQPEINLFRQIMDGLAQLAIAPFYGAHVSTLSKTSLGVQKINVSSSVNQGVNLVTFFGHSSSYTIDIDIGNVDDATLGYNNKSKYPVFIINGCNAGTMFADEVTFGENWMLTPAKGARNFLATTSFGRAIDLQTYSTLFYQTGFNDTSFMKRGIGDIQRETCRRLLSNTQAEFYAIALAHQMVMQGDPAVKIFSTIRPDYAIDNSSLSITSADGKPITSLSPSFNLKIIVKNLGATSAASLPVRVVRTFKDNTQRTYDSVYNAVLYDDTLTFVIHRDPSVNGFGSNTFAVTLDVNNTIPEVTKTNNTATLNYFVPSNGTINLAPSNFGIVGNTSVNLTFQDSDPLGQSKDFTVQLDTTISFTSPFLSTSTVTAKVLANHTVTIPAVDSVVYYWRTRPAKKTATDSADWTVSSFLYVGNSPGGWAQTKFAQINQNVLTGLTPNAARRSFDFTTSVTNVSVTSIGSSSSSPITDASIKINGVEFDAGVQVPCRGNTINFVAFNRHTALPYAGITIYNNDQRGCGLLPSVINSFALYELEAADGINVPTYVNNIPAGDSVIMFTVGYTAYSSWSANVRSKFGEMGVSDAQINALAEGEPVVFFMKKGTAPGSARIARSPSSPSKAVDLTVSATITGAYSTGKIQPAVIGPAKKWIRFQAASKTTDADDAVHYSIYGESLSGVKTLLFADAPTNLDLSTVDATLYPQLSLVMTSTDSLNFSAPQLRSWFVFYESEADGLLVFKGPTDAQTVSEGQSVNVTYGFVNISSQTFSDSLTVHQSIVNQNSGVSKLTTFKIKQPAPGDTSWFTRSLISKGMTGLNNVVMNVNPKILPEAYYDNNVVDLINYLTVISDKSPPILDVTVDGRYLQDGDFVSPNAVIQAKLVDDNSFLFVTDTTHLNLFVTYPCANPPCAAQRINYNRPDVSWQPATTSSPFTFKFAPAALAAGDYVLQASGTDASGNSSGAELYTVNFVVADATTLQLKSVYPNPSSDYFYFNFSVGGSVLPDDFSLELYALDGRALARFGMTDIGNFIIGENSLPWNAAATTASNGMIIYRMSVRANGKTAVKTGKLMLTR